MISQGSYTHTRSVRCYPARSIFWVKSVCFLLAVALVGCGAEEKLSQSDQAYEGVALVQVDSIMVPVMGNLRVFDYSPEQGLFIASDVPSAMLASMPGGPSKNELGIVLFNLEGEVVGQFMRSDEGPEGHGTSAADIFFMNKGTIGVLSNRGLFEYDFRGNLQHKYKSLHSRGMLGSPEHKIAEVGQNGHLAIASPKLTDKIYEHWDSLYLLAKPFSIYDLSKLENDEKLSSGVLAESPYPLAPAYQPGSKRLRIDLPPRVVMNENKNEVSLLFHEYPVLFTFSLETGKIVREVNLQPDDFGPHVDLPASEGQFFYDWINYGGWMASSYYHDLIQLGDYTLTRYNPALSSALVNELVRAKGPWSYELWPSMRKKNYSFRYQLFEGDTKLVKDFQLPALEPQEGQLAFKTHNRLMGSIIGGDGLDRMYVFITNDGEVERDYQLIRVYSLKLQ